MKRIFHLTGAADRYASSRLNAAIVWTLRVVVGCVFLFSGFTKAIDPWGGCYKFIEYFNAFGWVSMVPLSMACSVGLALLEFLLGLFTLTGCYRRGTPLLQLAFMCVMLPITAWLWRTNAIADCGCFGDAVHLTNWQTFAKNILLLPAILYLLIFNRRVHGIYGPAVNWAVALFGILFVVALAAVGYLGQPLIDFRAYPVGARISASSTAQASENDFVFTYQKDGVKRDFTIDSLPDDDSGWVYVDRRLTPAAEQKMPAVIVQSLSVADSTGVDVTDEALPDTGDVLIFTFPDLADVNLAFSFRLNALAERAFEQGAAAWAAASAPDSVVARWADESHANYPIYTVDDSSIKTLARGNPAVVFVHEGRVAWKRTLASFDNARIHDKTLTLAGLADNSDSGRQLGALTLIFVLCLLALLLVNRTHVAVHSVIRLFRHKDKSTTDSPSEVSQGTQAAGGSALPPEKESEPEFGQNEK